MKSATIAKFRNNLSRYLHDVRRGETVEILDRDVPVARVVGIAPPGPDATPAEEEARLQRLERKGIIKRGTGKVPPGFFDGFPPEGPFPPSAVEALLDERRKGR